MPIQAWELIPLNDRKGRLGVNYVRSVLAQSALPNKEFDSGEDHMAVDLTVEFPAAPVRVQVKCGARSPNQSGSISVPINSDWRDHWCASKVPVYLVYVRLEFAAPRDWIDHDDDHTKVHAHAHWVRVNGVSAASVSVPLANRLRIDTFATWNDQVEACFGKAVGL